MKPAARRELLREQLWPGGGQFVWNRKENDGFTAIPRILPLVMNLIEVLVPLGNPSRVYLALWMRTFDEGLVSIDDEESLAYESGYTGPRAVRTCRERLRALTTYGFIYTAIDGNREFGHVLLLNPIHVFVAHQRSGSVPRELWTAFVRRATEIGAKIPE